MKLKPDARLSREVQDILTAARNAKPVPGLPAPEPEEVEEAGDIAVYGLVANGCGRHEPRENANFISPLLLAA